LRSTDTGFGELGSSARFPASFIGGFTLFFWATGTWWIPLLVIVGFCRHVVERVPVTYYPHYWSDVDASLA
jgi:hypothetical protein